MPNRQESSVEQWRSFVTFHGFHDIVSPEDRFATCETEKWVRANATGLYCWLTENGEVYVGQAVKVRRRLLDHWKVHKDMIVAAFMEVDATSLSTKERDLIKAVGSKYPTRNIKHAFSTATFVPFDEFMSGSQREKFLSGQKLKTQTDWRPLDILEKKQAAKFRRLEDLDGYNLLLFALRTYVTTCIPMPARTENRFWSVTIYPGGANLVRVNAGQQEIFTIATGSYGFEVRVLALQKLDPSATGPVYEKASFVHHVTPGAVSDWLTVDRVRACRDLVLHLMRHTTTLNNGSHCPQIVRACLSSTFEPHRHRAYGPAGVV